VPSRPRSASPQGSPSILDRPAPPRPPPPSARSAAAAPARMPPDAPARGPAPAPPTTPSPRPTATSSGSPRPRPRPRPRRASPRARLAAPWLGAPHGDRRRLSLARPRPRPRRRGAVADGRQGRLGLGEREDRQRLAREALLLHQGISHAVRAEQGPEAMAMAESSGAA
jgi:hypothetical protein